MKFKTPFIYLLLGSPFLTIFGQENPIGDAIEQPELTWVVETLRADTLEPLEVAADQQWHVVTDVTSDGVDALSVKAPSFQPAIVRISTTTNGPFILKFKSRTDFPGSNTNFSYQLIDAAWPPSTTFTTIDPSPDWTEQTVAIIRDRNAFKLTLQVRFSGDQNAQAWLDELEVIREFPPTVEGSLPETFGIPINKIAKLQSLEYFGVVGLGDLRYQWYKDDEIVNGATERFLDLPAQATPLESSFYRLEISDDLGTATVGPIHAFYFDPAEALDNTELIFDIPDLLSRNYSNLYVAGALAPNGVDGLRLQTLFLGNTEYSTTIPSVSSQITGPKLLSFEGNARLLVNGISVEQKTVEINDEFGKTYIAIRNSLENTVSFQHGYDLSGRPIFGIIDQVQVFEGPVIITVPESQMTITGLERVLDFDYMSLGDTTFELIEDSQTTLTSNNPSINLGSLSEEDSGSYQLRITSEIGGSVTSARFEITVYPSIGDAVEQPNLEWIYEGEKIWIPQIFETYDGDDAAALLDEREGTGSVSTTLDGPAFVSFWYKNSTGFTVNELSAGLESPTDDWQKAEIALTSGDNQLTWRTGFFDRLQIEYVDTIGQAVEQPDLEWTYAGNRIWVPQTAESYDGVDAAALINDGEGNGTVSTQVEGPSLISFWWKDGATFKLNDEVLDYEGEGWQLVQQVAWEASNTLQ